MYSTYLCNNIVGTVPRNNGDSSENLWSGSQGCEIRRGPHTVAAPRAGDKTPVFETRRRRGVK